MCHQEAQWGAPLEMRAERREQGKDGERDEVACQTAAAQASAGSRGALGLDDPRLRAIVPPPCLVTEQGLDQLFSLR